MTKQVRQAITPTHILGSTGTAEGDDLGFRALSSFAGDLGPAWPSGSESAPTYTFSGDTNTGMFRPGANTLGWSTNGSERMRITSGGNVGVGTTSPGHRLDIVGGNTRVESIFSLSANVASPVFNVDYDAFTLPAPTNNRAQIWIVTAGLNNNPATDFRSFGYIIQSHSGPTFAASYHEINASNLQISLSASTATPIVRVKDTASGVVTNIRVSAICITPRG